MAEFLTGVSAAATFVAIPALFVPGVAEVVGLVALASAGAAALVDTSLMAGHTKDEHGRPFVTGTELTMAWATTGLAALGAGTAVKAGAAARGAEMTFTKEVTRQFARETFTEAGANVRRLARLREELGAAGAARWMTHIAGKQLTSMELEPLGFVGAGATVAVIGPALVAGTPKNLLAFDDMLKISKIDALPKAVLEDLHPGPPDLHLRGAPELRLSAPQMLPTDPPEEPVMDR